jgi:hypothetical protein
MNGCQPAHTRLGTFCPFGTSGLWLYALPPARLLALAFDGGVWRKEAAERVESGNELPFFSYPACLLSLEFLKGETRP